MKYWTKSWNFLYGCTKYRAGCTHCWALEMAKRMQGNGLLTGAVNERGEWTGTITYKPDRIPMPLSWRTPQTVAVCWMSDLFHKDVSLSIQRSAFEVMKLTLQHTYLLLTKWYERLPEILHGFEHDLMQKNIYIGVTVSNQKDADEARTALDNLHAYWRTWVSYEPALETVDWSGWLPPNGIVCGCESGSGARPMPADADIKALEYCQAHNVPFTLKQVVVEGKLGTHPYLYDRQWQEFPA